MTLALWKGSADNWRVRTHRRFVLPAIALLTLVLPQLSMAVTASIPPSARLSTAPSWPPGTKIVPFELRDGLILIHATLHSPSGHDASGLFVFDTGAPGFFVTSSVWNTLQLEAPGPSGSGILLMRRPLDQVDFGTARLTDLRVDGLIRDGVLDDDFLGLIGPSVLGDRAVVVDYAERRLAIVDRSLTLMSRDTTSNQLADRASLDRVRRSRSRYGAILSASAVAVPFRLFAGGRMLVTARVEETSPAWHSEPLTLLIDTGASACAIFVDAADERVARIGRWPRLRDMRFRTVLGESRQDLVSLPRLTLPVASGPVSVHDVAAGVPTRSALPDLGGELPDPIHGLLGYSFFRRFRLVIDYPDEVLWLSPAKAAGEAAAGTGALRPGPTADPGGSGLVLGSLLGRTSVTSVAPGSAAAASGVRPGDVVVSIDGKPVTNIDPDDAQQMLEAESDSVALVVVRREGVAHVVRLTRHRAR